ncbi:hypothetical protein [Mycoplasma sp. CSL10166]|uniref:hypothetical protein n=1 Tax=Mycoplasma sp. CSL10166 TaxID=2813825 RepID=UPI00197B7878|nr:hypothetical protein [Mycoplasma sp. CSL10166]MBN4084090.1 hypothetical protein [Mycoplasma sp. CSL10166]
MNETIEVSRKWGIIWVVLGIITLIPILYFNILWIKTFSNYLKYKKINLSKFTLEEEVKIEPQKINEKIFRVRELLITINNKNNEVESTLASIFNITKKQKQFDFYFYLLLFPGNNHISLNDNTFSIEQIINYWNNRENIFNELL